MTSPGGAPVGRLSLEVLPDTSRFGRELKAKLKRFDDFKVNVEPDLTGFRQRIEARLAAPFRVKVIADDDSMIGSSVSRSIARARPQIQKATRDTIAPAVDNVLTDRLKESEKIAARARSDKVNRERELLDINYQMLAVRRSMFQVDDRDKKTIRDLTAMHDRLEERRTRVRVEVEASRASLAKTEADVRAAHTRMQAFADANPVEIETRLDRDRLQRAASEAGSVFQRAMSGAFSFAGSAAKAGTIGIFGATAIAGVGAMATQIVPIAAAVGQMAQGWPIIAAGIGGAALSITALAVGTRGVMDAFKESGDPAKFAEALAKLAPSAQEFVRATVGLKPAFDALRMDVQSRLFDGLGEKMRALSGSFMPALRSSLNGVAGGLNDAATSLLDTIASPRFGRALEILGQNTGRGLSAAAPGFGFFTQGMAALSAGASAFFERAGNAFSAAGRRFSDWVDRIVADGTLDRWINNSIDAFKRVGSILGNIGSGLGSIFAAASASGVSMLDRFDQVTGRFAAWAKSTEGQDSLTSFFRSVSQVTGALAPVGSALMGLVPTIADSVAGIATEFAPFLASTINNLRPAFETLGDTLADIAPHLGGFLESVSEYVGPALAAIGPGAKDLFAALEKSGPAIGETLVALGEIGGTVLSGIAAVLPPIASFLSTISGLLSDLASALGPVPAAIAAFVAALAVKGILGGGGGGGLLGGGGALKIGVAVTGIALAIDAALSGVPETFADAGKQWGKGALGGFLTGFSIGGPLGGLIGAAIGTGLAFAPTFKRAGEQAWNTFKEAFTGAESGDNFTFSPAAFKANPLSFGWATEVQGRGSWKASSPEDQRRHDDQEQGVAQFYANLAQLYDVDAKLAEEYEKKKYKSKKEMWAAAAQMAQDMSATQAARDQKAAEMAAEREKKLGDVIGQGFADRAAAAENSAERMTSAMAGASTSIMDSFAVASAGAEGFGQNAVEQFSVVATAAQTTAEVGSLAFGSMALGAQSSASDSAAAWLGSLFNIQGQTQTTSGVGSAAFGAMGIDASSSAATAQASWLGSLLNIQGQAQAADGTISNAFFQSGNAASSSANQAGGTWIDAMGLATRSAWNFYGAFNNSIPQQAARSQASGVIAVWSGMGGMGQSLGSMFGQGIAIGIASKVGAVQAASARLAAAASAASASALRIASPSKVAIEQGEFYGEGLAIGIEGKGSRVVAAAEEIARAAAVPFAAASVASNRAEAAVGTTINKTVYVSHATVPSTAEVVDERGEWAELEAYA